MDNLFASLATATDYGQRLAQDEGLPFIADQWRYAQEHGEPGRHLTVLFSDDRGGHVVAYWNDSFYEMPNRI